MAGEGEILKAASSLGCKVWRNNTGVLKDKNGRPVRYGLCVGSADIIGMLPGGRFLAIEVKYTGHMTDLQRGFLRRVNEFGGLGICVRSVEDFFAQMAKYGFTR